MNTPITSLVLIAAAFSASAFSPLSAAPEHYRAIAYPVSSITVRRGSPVVAGTTRDDVIARMGKPDRQLTPDLWVYTGYYSPDVRQVNADGCTALMVSFTYDFVQDLKFVNPGAVRVYASAAMPRPQPQSVAAE